MYCCHRDTMIAVEIKFGGQALLFSPVTAGNLKHRKYDRSTKNMAAISREFIARIKQEEPPMVRNHVIFEMLHASPKTYLDCKSPSFCVNVTRHQPIIPYRHLLNDIWSFLFLSQILPTLKYSFWGSLWEFRSHSVLQHYSHPFLSSRRCIQLMARICRKRWKCFHFFRAQKSSSCSFSLFDALIGLGLRFNDTFSC